MTINREIDSLLLFAPPSASTGAAEAFDVFGTNLAWNESLSETQADMLATRTDWFSVARDIRRALTEYQAEQA